jgi:hypothetical protein
MMQFTPEEVASLNKKMEEAFAKKKCPFCRKPCNPSVVVLADGKSIPTCGNCFKAFMAGYNVGHKKGMAEERLFHE